MRHADVLRERAIELMADPVFTDVVTNNTSAPARVEKRFRLWKDMLDQTIEPTDGGRTFDRKTKEKLFADDPTCSICGQAILVIDDAHVDHVQPYAKGGATQDENAALAHRYCNQQKGAKTLEA